MKRAILALLVCAPSFAAPVYKADGLTVRLLETPCTVERIAQWFATNNMQAKTASISVRGAETRACWTLDEDGDVLIVDERGQGGFIPLSQFKEDGV